MKAQDAEAALKDMYKMIGYKEDSALLKPPEKPTELPPDFVHTRIGVSVTYLSFKYAIVFYAKK